MTQETKPCQNCKNQFTIEPEDFEFYKKIKVPAPTWCPECRMVRKMLRRSEWRFYKRKCDLCRRETFSMYPGDAAFPVYCRNCWWSDKWEPREYGRDYDFSHPFFVQFKKLSESVPHDALSYTNVVESEYLNYAVDVKNCYLIFGGHSLENVSYAKLATYTKDSMDVSFTDRSEFCYETVNCKKCFKVSFSRYAEDCRDSALLLDCRNCNNCIASVALRNKSYCIFNKQYSKEEYEEKLQELSLGSFRGLQELKSQFQHHAMNYPRRYAMIRNSLNVVGDDIYHAKNCFRCFYITNGAEDCRYCSILSDPVKDSLDALHAAFAGTELLYEVVSAAGQRIFFGHKIWYCHDVILSDNCHDSNNLFACIGLRNKSYCILNKQYTKEEYERLVPRIIEHMNSMPYVDSKGRVYRYGEFFPPEFSPFAYNETVAQEQFPLTKERALAEGYRWKDPEPRNYQVSIFNDQLPDHIKDVQDDIVGQVIECGHKGTCNEQCTEAFKIIPMELEFLRKMNLPLPRLCPNCRHYQRIKQRNPLKLWHRACQCAGEQSENSVYKNTATHRHGTSHCPEEFETSYAPERPEIVYCEACYQQEVI